VSKISAHREEGGLLQSSMGLGHSEHNLLNLRTDKTLCGLLHLHFTSGVYSCLPLL
jgi:hypothetical protein